jgi:hypothetical protein
MVSQKDVMNALKELGGKATVREIASLMYLKKQVSKEYSPEICSIISRCLNAMQRWQEVGRTLNIYKPRPVTDTGDIWFIRKD